jgi:hypothetical protein
MAAVHPQGPLLCDNINSQAVPSPQPCSERGKWEGNLLNFHWPKSAYLQVAAVHPQGPLVCYHISSQAEPPAPARLFGSQRVALLLWREVPVYWVMGVLYDAPAGKIKPALRDGTRRCSMTHHDMGWRCCSGGTTHSNGWCLCSIMLRLAKSNLHASGRRHSTTQHHTS